MLEFHQVRKSYPSGPVLSIDSQRLLTGIYWLQGANGSGKTTLIRIIAGITPFQGDILMEGRSQRRQPVAYRHLVGWADAEPLFPGFLTGEEVINFYSGVLHPEASQVARLIQQLDIGAWLGTRLAGWSSGMTKKLALLLAFLGHPAWIMLDEPLITLDGKGVSGLLALIREYHGQYGAGFLLSSHQPLPDNPSASQPTEGDWLPITSSIILENKSIRLI